VTDLAPPLPSIRRQVRTRDTVTVVGRYAGLLLAAVLILIPLYYLVYIALSVPGREFKFPPGALPDPTRLQNLPDAWNGSTSIGAPGTGSLAPYFLNSVMYVGLATLGALITQSIVAYALARMDFPGKSVIFALTVAMLMMPFVVTLIPRFLLFRNLGLTNSLWPLIIPWWFGGSAYGIFLMRQFFLTIPREIDEAARVDGAGHWRILWRILIPQSTPILVALGILEGSYFWNDLLGPLIYVDSESKKPLSLGIFFMSQAPYGIDYALFFAITVLMVLPIALIFLVLQRRFRSGFLHSGLGGR
jgi:multiple sugar transport system permease protein